MYKIKLVVVLFGKTHLKNKQQLSKSEDDYEILSLEIGNYKPVVPSLIQHISKKQQLCQSEEDYEFAEADFKRKNFVVVVKRKNLFRLP